MADVELLPSSVAAFVEALKGERGSLDAWLEVNNEREVAAHVEAYARANLAPLQSEIEALRTEIAQMKRRLILANTRKAKHKKRAVKAEAEIERLRTEVAEWKRVAAAQAELHGEAEDRADRLAKTLRSSADVLERLAFAIPAPNTHTPQLVELAIAMRATALA